MTSAERKFPLPTSSAISSETIIAPSINNLSPTRPARRNVHAPTRNKGTKKKGVLLPSSPRYVSETRWSFGIIGVVEVDVVAEELTACWMVAEL
jgi:hypothetical protein